MQTETDIWALAYVERSQLVEPPEVENPTWLVAPSGRYFADPFLVEHGGETWVFFEDYDLNTQVGHIGASPLKNFQARPALTRPWHLSYPFLIPHEGELYCVPEQHQAGRVSLYRCETFPNRWVEEAVLLENFAGVDPTLLWDGKLWWMWVGEQSRRARDNTFVFTAQHLHGPWIELPESPAIARTDLARPAGPVWPSNGRWIRPVQNRTRTYGGGMALFETDLSSQDLYRETELTRWEPRADWPFPDGLHHLCRLGDITIWDAKKVLTESSAPQNDADPGLTKSSI